MAEDEPDRDVMSSLPRTRPQRRSAKRDAPAKRAAPANGKRAEPADGKRSAAKPKAAPKRAAGARAAEGGGSARATAKSKAKPRAQAAKMPAAGFQPPRDARGSKPPSGTELVGTAVQAAAELAQIGLAVGGHALRSALDRLPPRRGT